MIAPMWKMNRRSSRGQTDYYPFLVKDKNTKQTELFMIKLLDVKEETLNGVIAVTQGRVANITGKGTVILGGKTVGVNVPKTQKAIERLDTFALFEFNLEINNIRAYREKDVLRTEL